MTERSEIDYLMSYLMARADQEYLGGKVNGARAGARGLFGRKKYSEIWKILWPVVGRGRTEKKYKSVSNSARRSFVDLLSASPKRSPFPKERDVIETWEHKPLYELFDYITERVPDLKTHIQISLRKSGASDELSRHSLDSSADGFNLLGQGLIVVDGKIVLRPEQKKFRKRALELYGSCCAVCDFSHHSALDGAHLCPKREQGSDNPLNGIVLCASHHRLFDQGLFLIHPDTLKILLHPCVGSPAQLGITRSSLAHLPVKPHSDALRWRSDRWQELYGQGSQ